MTGCHNESISIWIGSKVAANGKSIFSGLGIGVHGAAADQNPTILIGRFTRWVILAADARIRRPAVSGYCAAADGDLGTGGAEPTVTDTGCAVCAVCGDIAAADGDFAAGSHYPAADTRGLIAAGGGYCTARDGDTANLRASRSIADACALIAAGCIHDTVVDLNRKSTSVGSAADTRRLITALCSDFAAVDDNTAAFSLHPAADTGTVYPAGCVDRTAVDDDVGT